MNASRTTLSTLAAAALLLSACSIDVSSRGEGEDTARTSAGVTGTFAPRARAATPPVTSHCSPAPQIHTTALCVCRDLSLSGELTTKGANGRAADVGVEGSIALASGSSIGGSVRATGDVSSSGELAVAGHLWSRTEVSVAGELRIDGDLATGGDLVGAGTVDVLGATRIGGAESFAGSVSRASTAPYAAPSTTPCGCDEIYDVPGAVAAARATNDNAAVDLDASGFVKAGEHTLSLPSGRYYLASFAQTGDLEVRARGAVQLYVDGDVALVGASRFAIDPGGSLDLFVAGSVAAAGSVELGDATRPDAFRLYVGGKGSRVELAGEQTFRGLVYAPTSEVSIAGETSIEGALFAGSLAHAGSLAITYAAVTTQGERCEHPEATPTPEPVVLR